MAYQIKSTFKFPFSQPSWEFDRAICWNLKAISFSFHAYFIRSKSDATHDYLQITWRVKHCLSSDALSTITKLFDMSEGQRTEAVELRRVRSILWQISWTSIGCNFISHEICDRWCLCRRLSSRKLRHNHNRRLLCTSHEFVGLSGLNTCCGFPMRIMSAQSICSTKLLLFIVPNQMIVALAF